MPMSLTLLRRVIEQVSEALALLGGAILIGLACYTIVDVSLRALLNAPLPGAVDVVSYGLGLVVACVLPLGFAHDHHVSVALLSDTLKGRARAAVLGLVTLVSGGFMGLLAYRATLYAAERAKVGDRMWILQFEVWPVWAVIAAMMWVTTLVLAGLLVLRLAETLGFQAGPRAAPRFSG